MTKESGEKSSEMKKDLPGEVRLVPVNDAVVPEKRMRELGDITPIMDSIKDVGLIEPIIIRRETRELISGLHRLESIRALGQPKILARLVDVSDVQAAMMELDENLARVELTAFERAEHMARRKQFYEALHPEAKHGGAPGKAGGGKEKSKGARAASFAADTAKRTGLSVRTVQEDVQIAGMSPEAKRLVKGTRLARIIHEPRREARETAENTGYPEPEHRKRTRSTLRMLRRGSARSFGRIAGRSRGLVNNPG